MKYVINIALCSLAILLLSMRVSHAQNYSANNVTITSIGCQNNNTVCYVTVSGGNYGPSGCNTNSIRWDSSSTPNGLVAVAQLTAAYVTGTSVSFVLSNSCFSENGNYPTMLYYVIG